MTPERKSELLEQVIEVDGGEPEDYLGRTLEEVLVDLESSANVNVYWGCWTLSELQECF